MVILWQKDWQQLARQFHYLQRWEGFITHGCLQWIYLILPQQEKSFSCLQSIHLMAGSIFFKNKELKKKKKIK